VSRHCTSPAPVRQSREPGPRMKGQPSGAEALDRVCYCIVLIMLAVQGRIYGSEPITPGDSRRYRIRVLTNRRPLFMKEIQHRFNHQLIRYIYVPRIWDGDKLGAASCSSS